MITEIKCYMVTCDTCGEKPDAIDYIPHFDSPKDFEADQYDWTAWKDKDWCESCGPPFCTCEHTYIGHDYGEGPCDDDDGCSCTNYEPEKKVVASTGEPIR